MIVNSTDFDRVAFQIFQNSGHAAIDFYPNVLRAKKRSPILGGKDRMNKQSGKRWGHVIITKDISVVDKRFGRHFQGDFVGTTPRLKPRLKPWDNLFRHFMAGTAQGGAGAIRFHCLAAASHQG